MIDEKRLERVHVLTVRAGKEKDTYVVVLYDPTYKDTFTVSWDHWIKLSEHERRNYQ